MGLGHVSMVVFIVALALVAVVVGYLIGKRIAEERFRTAHEEAEHRRNRLIEEAKGRAKQIVLEAQDEALQIRREAEREVQRRRREIERQEDRLQRRQEHLEKRLEQLETRERTLNQREQELEQWAEELSRLEEERRAELERVASMTVEEAREELLRLVEQESREDMARLIREIEEEAKAHAQERAREIITLAIERLASEHVSETTVTSVPLPSDDMKGRIIGRQGRNIRAIENATGVDIIVDDTPEAITISSFDPVRREVARRALTRLVQDGRIHPARIEKEVEKAREEVEEIILKAGEEALLETGIANLHPDLVRLLGRLKFRTSYGQNQWAHAIEVAHLSALLAAELGADVYTAKLGGLLHDIGKAVSHEMEGPHALVGADIARRAGLPEKVVNCIASHHGEEEPKSLEAIIVATADAISGARPGARRESLEAYIKRVTALEELAKSFPGVEEAYAIQAGREVRIIVKPDQIDDLGVIELSRAIAQKVEESLEYPGQIKVTVIREMRATEYAK